MTGLPHPLITDSDSDFEHEFPDDVGAIHASLKRFGRFSSPESQSSNSSSSSHSDPSILAKKKYLYPVSDTVEDLRPEEVRWFYREVGSKKWTAFIGYDSLRIECKYREEKHNKTRDNTKHSNKETQKEEKICVRGSLYEVSVVQKKCFPIYWHKQDQTSDIMRGTWFMDSTWQPLEESVSEEIEREHLIKFKNETIAHTAKIESAKGLIPVLHTMPFEGFYIEWNANSLVSLHYESTGSKLYRAIGKQFGITTNIGTRIHRGYFHEARIDDKEADIGHLVFVVHGIGQKMETGNIVLRCDQLREQIQRMKEKHLQEPDTDQQMKRAEFLPVEWRSSLKLDGDIVESITPAKLRRIRDMLNCSAMDIMYYTSPLYRSEIIGGLQIELNRLYDMFCERTPYFEASGGKVSIIAHSLGSVIMYDIMTGWNPIQLYDQYVSRVIGSFYHESCEHPAEATCAELDETGDAIVRELEYARQNVSNLEKKLFSLAEKQQIKTPNLKFTPTNFFCLGSPLAVFLALRGVRPTGGGTQDHILPKHLCSRLFNIYHPYDPVAYRLEPLIIKAYGTIAPIRIFRHDSTKRVPYDSIPAIALKPKHASKAKDVYVDIEKEERNNNTDREKAKVATPTKPESKSNDNKKSSPEKEKKDSGGGWTSFFRRRDKEKPMVMSEMTAMDHSAPSTASSSSPSSSPTKARDPYATVQDGSESDATDIDMKPVPESPEIKLFTDPGLFANDSDEYTVFDVPDHTELEFRLDYQLHEGKMENAYWSALTSHTGYWTNNDVALFILQQLFPGLEPS